MTPDEIKTLFSSPGVYVLKDTRVRGATVPIVSRTIDGQEVTAIRVFMLQFASELSPDPAQWEKAKDASLAGGPFGFHECIALEKQGERLELLEAAVAEAKDYARLCRDVGLSQDLPALAQAMQVIMDTLTPEQAPA